MINFENTMVRILEINIKNYKNTSNGTVEVSTISNIENGRGDIRGIYGQNGSGKTSIISAMSLIKNIFSGMPLPEDIDKYIKYGENESEINVLFFIENDKGKYKAKYSIIIAKNEEGFFIQRETLSYWDQSNENDNWNKVKVLIDNQYDKSSISPKYRNDEISGLFPDYNDLIVMKKIKFRDHQSFIFSDELLRILDSNSNTMGDEFSILQTLNHYAVFNLLIIDNKQMALSNANILLPINFKNYEGNIQRSMGVMPIGLEKATYLPKFAITEIQTSLDSSNMVLSEIIPGLTIKLQEVSVRISKSGQEEVAVELMSCRDGVEIAIRYESDGIKKIVAIIHLLISMFNYSSMTLLIDELDSGVFEYLLGEILEILEERGKGQLIFTSHNLRPLEVLSKNSLVFTTTNPDNRYIKLKNVKANNNIRDMYYRDLILDGQDEIIYGRTNSPRIARAFRKAGE